MTFLSRRGVKVVLGLVAAAVLAAVLVAPVALRDQGGNGCSKTLAFRGATYTARRLDGFVQSIAIGVGVASGCGTRPANVDIRSVLGIAPARAIALPADDTSVYVRRGLCGAVAESRLMRCLSARA